MLLTVWVWMCCLPANAEESPVIRAAIDRSLPYLQAHLSDVRGGHKTLVALALFKAGTPLETPALQGALKDIQDRCAGGQYQPMDGNASIYAAALDATFLVDTGGERYRPQVQVIANYLLRHQLSTGGWEYPDTPVRPGSVGDTSVTQYACLGLWAVERSGIKIDPGVWLRVLDWHVKSQNPDGGYAYLPSATANLAGSNSTLNMTVNGVASMHIAMLHLAPDLQPLKQNRVKQVEAPVVKKFGILEEVKLQEKPVERRAAIPQAAIEAVRKAYGFVVARYSPLNPEAGSFQGYYLYSLERMAALANVSLLGERDWYQSSSAELLKRQQADGSVQLGQGASVRDTAFAVLFLVRATAKVLQRSTVEPGFGEGLLAGGRGLPDDLVAVQLNGRTIRGQNQPVPPLDQLLAALQSTGEIPLDQVQEQLVEQIQIGDRRSLVGQVDLLKDLARHSNAEVRRSAIWAIGRTDRLDLGTLLINSLDDPDLGVMIEARNALCWLSRRPNGFGEAEDPLANLLPGTPEIQKNEVIAGWHRELILHWGRWYLDARPFAERGDEFEADLKRRITALKQETATAPR